MTTLVAKTTKVNPSGSIEPIGSTLRPIGQKVTCADSSQVEKRRYQSEFSLGCDLLSLQLNRIAKERKEKGVKDSV
jgi:hypothetical protein